MYYFAEFLWSYLSSSSDAHQGVLRLWNVSKPTPILSLKLKSTGFHSLCVFNASPHGTGDYDDPSSSSSSPSHTGNHVSSTSQAVAPRRTNDHHMSYALPPGHAVCTFDDGGVGLYDLGKKRWDFLRELVSPYHLHSCLLLPNMIFLSCFKRWQFVADCKSYCRDYLWLQVQHTCTVCDWSLFCRVM